MEINDEILNQVKSFIANGESVDAICEKLGIEKETVTQMLNNVSAEDLNKAASLLSNFKLGK